jgi:hypothetical protein
MPTQPEVPTSRFLANFVVPSHHPEIRPMIVDEGARVANDQVLMLLVSTRVHERFRLAA